MTLAARWVVICVCCCAGLLAPSLAAAEGGSFSVQRPGTKLASSLVTAGSPAEHEQLQAKKEVMLASPQAVAEREASRTKYAGLDSEQAARVDQESFPTTIDSPVGGPPPLPAGQTVAAYPADDVAQVDVGGGGHAIVESSEPMAIETTPGHRDAIDLHLGEVAGAFLPVRPAITLRIPKQLADGVEVGDTGVALTPVGEDGVPLGGSEGVIEGATVLYANTEVDADTVVKPVTLGFEAETLLRSIESPEALFYRVGLPEGARLVAAPNGSGAAEVLDEGAVLAVILPPSAQDAAGTPVPVSMNFTGDIVTLTVDRSGEYKYPIAVDPTVIDHVHEPYCAECGPSGNWKVVSDGSHYGTGGEREKSEGEGGYTNVAGELTRGEYLDYLYTTQGESKITYFRADSTGTLPVKSPERPGKDYVAILNSSYEAGPVEVVEPYGGEWHELSATGSYGNSAVFEEIGATTEVSEDTFTVYHSEVEVEQTSGPHAAMDTSEEVVAGRENALDGSRWASTKAGKWGFQVNGTDPGLGIKKVLWSASGAPKWKPAVSESVCHGPIQCPTPLTSGASLQGYGSEPEQLPEGEATVEAKVEDPVGLTASTGAYKVKVDDAPPRNITLSGLPSDHEISDGQHVLLKASATDGTKPTLSSGVASIVLTMDGQEVGSPSKGCSPGECTATGEWTLSGESYAAGTYTLAVVATDNAGNVATEEFQVTVHHAGDVSVGPASVSPTTGEMALSATDVSVGGADGGLMVGRSYRSRHLGGGAEGPLGSQWSLNLGAQESLSRTPSGSMVLTSTSGEQSVFASNGKGGYGSPPGDAGIALSEEIVGKATEFLLSENGSVTTFAVPSGGSGGLWEPAISEGAGGTNAVTFAYKTEGGITEPTEELAPVPAGVSCVTLKKGCRALSFVYATKSKETIGEGPGEWGEYKGRLAEVTFTAYEPSSKEMKTKAVAQYAYDKQGRLRAEWNPQIRPALMTIYGYDSEGHVTSLAPAGQQPWLFEQGTTPGDAAPGRVLAIARPAATTESVLKGEMEAATPEIMTPPTLSNTTPTVGVKISVASNGTWSNNPLAYSLQWEDCNSSGKECTPIPGAVNQSYYPVAGDEGHTLAAEVFALNANGSAASSSGATAKVAAGTPYTPLPEPPSVGSLAVWTVDYQVPLTGTGVPQMSGTAVGKWGQIDIPWEATAVFPPDAPMGWPAKEYTRASIYYLDDRDRIVNLSSPTGGISTTEYNLDNDIVRTLSPDNRAAALAAGEEKSKEVSKELDTESIYEEGGSEPGTELQSTLGPKHTIELTSGTKAAAREHTVYSYNEGAPSEGGPYHLVTTTTEGAEVGGKEEAASIHTTETSYSGQDGLGWKLRKPTSITVDPTGLKLTHSIFYEPRTGNLTETRLPGAGAPDEEGYSFQFEFGKSGTKEREFKEPQGIAVNSSGDEYVLDTGNDRVEEYNAEGKYIRKFGEKGTGENEFIEPRGIAVDGNGNVWIADTGNNRIEEFNSEGKHLAQTYLTMKEPQGIAVKTLSSTEYDVMVVDAGENRVEKLICTGSGCTLSNEWGTKGAGEEQFNTPQGIAIGAEGHLYITDTGNDRIDEYTEGGKHIRNFGKEGSGNEQLKEPRGIATDAHGNVWVADAGNNRIEEFGTTGTFLQVFGTAGTSEGQMKTPKGITIDSEGNAWITDTGNNRVQEWTPNGAGYGVGATSAHDTQTIYYTAGENTKLTACGEHPEWANLPCQTQPAAQPEGSLPKLPATTYTYNIWDEPETTTNTSGATTRATTATYDPAGRLKATEIKSTAGTALPTVTDKYSETLGTLEEQGTEGKSKPIISHYNNLGQLTSYSDASETTSAYEYDIDGRIKTLNDGKGTESYTYSKTTGLPTELLSEYGTAKLLFTGTYDPEGDLLSEGYPNGMKATYSYNAVGKPISLEYEKTTHCTTGCTWFSDTAVPSIHGQWLEQTSSFSHQAYSYDNVGRLTQVQNTPTTTKECTTRIYAYEEDTNRTSLTTRPPASGGKCATEGGPTEKHTYDTADRLTDEGVSYNAFGDITTLPATDAGGKEPSEELTSTYYVDNQLASQTQNGQTIGYNLDPDGRTLETLDTGKKVSDITNHYAGPGSAAAWTSNSSGEWTRLIHGLSGFAAVENNGETPVLELANLHGDIIATASLSETATALASTADTSEYGVPTTSLPPKYSWLGADEIPTELPSGVLDMGARSYVPQLGRFLQPDPILGGSANAYTYTFGDPVNASDPSGEETVLETLAGHAAEVGHAAQAKEEAEIAARRAAEEAAARTQAETAARQAAWAAEFAAGPQYAGEGENWGEEEWFEEEWYEEEGEQDYASYDGVVQSESKKVQAQPGVLYQSLGEAAEAGERSLQGATGVSSVVPLCKAGVAGPCALLTTWIHHVSGRTVRVLCAVVAFQCGSTNNGDERFENYLQSNLRTTEREGVDDLPQAPSEFWEEVDDGIQSEVDE